MFDDILKYGAGHWSDWGMKYWGCPWIEVYQDKITQTNQSLKVQFGSKWGPPSRLLEKISKDYPNLKFNLEWVVFGMGDGIIDACNGVLIESDRDTEDW